MPRIPKYMFATMRPEHLTKHQWRNLLRSLLTRLTKEEQESRAEAKTDPQL